MTKVSNRQDRFRKTSVIAIICVAFELSLHLHPSALCDLYNTCTGSHQKIPLTPHLINTITIYIKSHNNHKFFNHTSYIWCKDEFLFNFQVLVILLLSHRLKWSILKWPQENNLLFLERLDHR